MKNMWVNTVLLVFGCVLGAQALNRSDLSPAAQKFVPEEDIVILMLKNGLEQKGVVVSRSDEGITLRQSKGAIEFERLYTRELIASAKVVDLCEALAQGVLTFEIDPAKSYTREQYKSTLALFKEYLEKCGESSAVEEIGRREIAFSDELAKLNEGMEKIGGEWLPAVAAAVKKFDLLTERMAQLEKKYPGVSRDGYDKTPKARQYFERYEEARRTIARDLPQTVTARIPLLIQAQKFHEAVSEMTAFTQFFLTRVIQSEAGGTATGYMQDRKLQQVFKDMDFGYIIRLERQIMKAYQEHYKAAPTPDNVPEEMVFMPGGFTVMGDPDADITDDTFPMRIVFVNPFMLDRYEVTNKDYREFVDYVKSSGDYTHAHPDAPPLKDFTPDGWKLPGLSGDDQPVVGVDWFDAYAYSKWKGKRLPTEAEWEAAARLGDERKYPWGEDTASVKFINWPIGRRLLENEINRLTPPPPPPKKGLGSRSSSQPPPPRITLTPYTWAVNQKLDAKANHPFFDEVQDTVSSNGVYHIIGNAAEWVYDYYDPTGFRTADMINPDGPEEGIDHVFKGGSFQTMTEPEMRATYRGIPDPSKHPQLTRRKFSNLARGEELLLGFRCAQSVDDPEAP